MNISELTADQIFELEITRIAMQSQLEDILIPIFVIVSAFVVPAVVVILVVWFITRQKNQYNKLKAEVMAKAIESGQTLPENFFDEPKKQRNLLKTGIICIAVGIGIALFIWLAGGAVQGYQLARGASLGIIPFLVGVAYIIIHFVEKKK
ncbi:MAG: DUF6249 domain-containing protein [Bacteroidales bacterium]|nr:DUF6249 domain-containing protein [Bacteroidales bacterium]